MIALNADVGEGIGNEAALFPLLDQCNIACGGHSGNTETMTQCIQLAQKYDVQIGAHPSFPDTLHFGRKVITLSRKRLQETLTQQIKRIMTIAAAQNAKVVHIKPHGALYNLAATDEKTATILIETILQIDDTLALFVPYDSLVAQLAAPRLKIVVEGFADRAYTDTYTLVSRSKSGAVLEDVETILAHVKRLLNKELQTISGHSIPIKLDTLCVHGDTPKAIKIATAIRHLLTK